MTKKRLVELLNDLGPDDTEVVVTTFAGDVKIRCVWEYQGQIFIETNDFEGTKR